MKHAAATELLPPLPETMATYGLTPESWRQIVAMQGGVCAICRKLPASGRLCIDHIHVAGWKHMKPGQRALYVRGLLCFVCNRYYCGRGITIAKAKNLVKYLEQPLPFSLARGRLAETA